MKNLFYILIFLSFLSCKNSKRIENSVMEQSKEIVSEDELVTVENKPKTIFERIQIKKENPQNIPEDFDFSKNYTEKELKVLNLNPNEINSDEYYFLSEQKFLEEDIEGISFRMYYRHFYGNQAEKILRVQRRDTIFDIILAGQYSNGSDGSTLSTEFRIDNRFRKAWTDVRTVKDEPNSVAYDIDSLWTFYHYNDRFDLAEETKFSSKYYKQITKNPETGKQDTLFEQITSLGKIRNTELIYGVSYIKIAKNHTIPEAIRFYTKHKNTKTKLKTFEVISGHIDNVELFTIGNDYFIYVRLMETSGNSHSYFYAVDIQKMILNEVEEDYGNFKIPDSLEIHKGFGISREKDNRFISGSRLRSKNTGEYYLEEEYKMIKKNNKFVLKCISAEIIPI